MVNRIYPSELQLNKANVSDAEASFLDLPLSISDGFVKTKIYDKRDDFDIVNFPFRVVLGWAYRDLTGGFLLLQNFSVAISVSPHVSFILVLILISMF